MGGIATQASHSLLSVSIGAVLLALSIALVAIAKKPMALLCIAPFWLAGSVIYWKQERNSLSFYERWNKNCMVRAQVNSIECIDNPRFSYKITLDIATIKKISQPMWSKSNNTLALYVSKQPDFLVGDTIEMSGLTFKKPTNAEFYTYLCKEKIAATLFMQQVQSTLIERPSYSLARGLYYYKEWILNKMSQAMNKETFALVSSIFLGSKSNVKSAMEKPKESFKVWGISHQLARSGLHLVFLAIVWHFICSILPVPFFYKQLLLILLITSYSLLSWASISFTRALLMFLFYKCYTLTRVATHYVHLICLVTLIVLMSNPYQLFFLDFQLSFGITFALAWLSLTQGAKKRLA